MCALRFQLNRRNASKKGIVHGNKDKFTPQSLDFMLNYAQDLLQKFDYAHLLLGEGTAAAEKF